MDEVSYVDKEGNYWDEVTGKQLDAEGVRKARAEEMGHVNSFKV